MVLFDICAFTDKFDKCGGTCVDINVNGGSDGEEEDDVVGIPIFEFAVYYGRLLLALLLLIVELLLLVVLFVFVIR